MAEPAKIHEIYRRYIKPLAPMERRRLLALMARDLAQADEDDDPHERSLLEFEGLGAEIWHNVDAQAYIHALRDEWGQHS
jgi:hypothetical protein